MSSTTAANYLPDSMVITLKEHFDALADPDDPVGFETPERLGFLFHEWMHYLHNVSTLHGLTAFANAMQLWAGFRHTRGPDGFSGGSVSCPPQYNASIQQRLEYRHATRFPQKTTFPKAGLNNLALKKTELVETPISGTNLVVSKIRCTVEDNGQGTLTTVDIGTHEILEGLAWLLEEQLIMLLGTISSLPSPVPYLLARNILLLLEPTLAPEDIIACLIRALQDSDPPATLYDCVVAIPRIVSQGKSVYKEMEAETARTLAGNVGFENQIVQEIAMLVPVDEPMGRFVLQTIAQIRQNLDRRRTKPFLEFDLVDEIGKDRRKIEAAIRKFGGCTLLQKRPGQVDDVERDLLFHLSPTSSDDLDGGRLKLHTAFRYMHIHIQNAAFKSTAQLPTTGGACQCPLYTTCTLPHRKEHAIVCWESPWKTALVTDDSVRGCSYKAAVIGTTGSPPSA